LPIRGGISQIQYYGYKKLNTTLKLFKEVIHSHRRVIGDSDGGGVGGLQKVKIWREYVMYGAI